VSVRVSGPAKDVQVFFCEEEAQSLNVSGEGFKDLLKGLGKFLLSFSELSCECLFRLLKGLLLKLWSL